MFPHVARTEQLCRDLCKLNREIKRREAKRDQIHAELRDLAADQRQDGAQSTTLRGVGLQVVVEFRRAFKLVDPKGIKSKLGTMFARFAKLKPATYALTKEGRQFLLGSSTLGLKNAARVRKQIAAAVEVEERQPYVGEPAPLPKEDT